MTVRGHWTHDQRVASSTRGQITMKWLSTRTVDCLQMGKSLQYITNTKVKSTFHPSKVGTSLLG